MINARRILEFVPIPEIKRVAAQFQVKCETVHGKDGEERLVLPTDKKELKNLLRLFAQDFLECALTDDKFRVRVDGEVALVAVKAARGGLVSVAGFRIDRRDDPIESHPPSDSKETVLALLQVLAQHRRQ